MHVEFCHNFFLKFYHNFSFWVLLQFEFWTFVTIGVLECHQNFGFWVLSQFKFFSFHYTQTVRADELKVWDNVQAPPCATFPVSHVMCHVSIVFFFTKWLIYSAEGLLSTGPTPSSLISVISEFQTLFAFLPY